MAYGAVCTHLTSTEQHGKAYAQRHIQGQKNQHIGRGEAKSRKHNQQYEKTEVVLDREHQPPQQGPMELMFHHVGRTRQERTTS